MRCLSASMAGVPTAGVLAGSPPEGVAIPPSTDGLGRRVPFLVEGLGQPYTLRIQTSISSWTDAFAMIQGSCRISRGAGRSVPEMIRLQWGMLNMTVEGWDGWRCSSDVPSLDEELHGLTPRGTGGCLCRWLVLELRDFSVDDHTEQLNGA